MRGALRRRPGGDSSTCAPGWPAWPWRRGRRRAGRRIPCLARRPRRPSDRSRAAGRIHRNLPAPDHGSAGGTGALARALGRAGPLIRRHRQVSRWAISLICAHVVLITIGYAQAARSGLLAEIWTLLHSYPDILSAAVGFGLLVLASVISYRRVRRRLRYETWWVVHLYLYLALALAFAHQIVTGVVLIGHPLVRRCGSSSGRPPLGWCWYSGSGSPPAAACATSCASSRCAQKRRAWSRSSAAGTTSTNSRCLVVSSSSGDSSPGNSGGRRTRTRCPPCPGRPSCASRSRDWATRAAPCLASGQHQGRHRRTIRSLHPACAVP